MTGYPNLYVSTACLSGEQAIEQRIIEYTRHHLCAIELGAGVRVHGLEVEHLPKIDIRYLVHNYFPPPVEPFVLNLASANPHIRERSLQLVEDALSLSAQMNAPFYSVHAGFVTDPVGFDGVSFVFPEPDSASAVDEALDRFVQALDLLLVSARARGLKLLVENNVCTAQLKGRLLLQQPEEFQQLFARVSSPFLGVLLDFGHLNVSAKTWGFDPRLAAQILLPVSDAFHIHQNDGYVDSHFPVTEDQGWILDILRSAAEDIRPMVIEAKFETAEQLAEHKQWLSSFLRSKQDD